MLLLFRQMLPETFPDPLADDIFLWALELTGVDKIGESRSYDIEVLIMF